MPPEWRNREMNHDDEHDFMLLRPMWSFYLRFTNDRDLLWLKGLMIFLAALAVFATEYVP